MRSSLPFAILTPLLGLLAHAAVAAAEPSPEPPALSPPLPETCYLFSSFRGNGEDGLHLAWSTDGLRWTALRGDRSFLRPEVGNAKLMRDPHIIQGPEGTFHMVWTVSWTDRVIGYASSRDLLTWSPQREIPVMMHEPTARNCWAPELAYDDEKGHFLIFWSTTIPGRFPDTNESAEGYDHRIYCTTTKDFQTFTPTGLFYENGFNVIDATILRDGSTYYLFVKDETLRPEARKYLQVARAERLEGPYTELSEPFTDKWVEGPSAIKIGDDFVVYFDLYTKHTYGAMRSRDLVRWENISDRVSFPKGTRHGTAFPVKREVLQKLLEAEAVAESPVPQPATTAN